MKKMLIFFIAILVFSSGVVFAAISEVNNLNLVISYSEKNTNDVEKMAIDIPVLPASTFSFLANDLKAEVIYNRLDDGKSSSKIAELQFKIFKGTKLISSPKIKVPADQQGSIEVDGDAYKLKVSALFHSGS